MYCFAVVHRRDCSGGLWMITVFVIMATTVVRSSEEVQLRQEYCDGERFHFQCPGENVILIRSAQFGRIKLGKCVKSDLGSLGCQSDVTAHMDRLCSGRGTCDLGHLHRGLFEVNLPCSEMSLHLDLSYMCVSVLDASPVCHSPDRSLSLTRSPVYLLGKDIMALSCIDQPPHSMKVHASPGQLIKAGLIDFRPNTGNAWSGCVHYGDIIESKTRQRTQICGGQGRERELMTSNSNELQIEWNTGVDNPHFMIKFEIIGCPDLASPKFGSVSRDGDESTIGCDHSRQTWHLRCVDNTWVGVVGNCSAAGIQQKSSVKGAEKEEPWIPDDVVMTLIVAGSIVACLAIVTVGIVCWRRKNMEAQIAKMKSTYPKLPKGSGSRPDSEYMMPSYPGGAPRDETEDALYDFCFTPGNAPANPSNVPNNMATAVTLPYRNNLNQSLMYNNTMLPPESGQYKTLIVVRPQ